MTTPSEDDMDFAADLDAAITDDLKDGFRDENADAAQRAYNRDETGRFAPKPEDASVQETPSAAATAQPAATAATPPWRPTWYKDEYGPWDKLAEPFRNALRDQERNAATEIQKRGEAAKVWEPIGKALEPHAARLAAQGSNPQQFVSNLIAADQYLTQDPVAGVGWVVQQYLGHNLSAAGYSPDVLGLAQWMLDSNQQPQRQDPMQAELAQLKQQVQQLSNYPQQARMEAVSKQIADWSADKPDFAAVRDHMAALAKQNPEASLDQLYEQARWAHPETRERILKEQEDKRVAALKDKRQAGAQSPRGTPVADGKPRPQKNKSWDIEKDIGEALDELGVT